jgi:hypothetical protein
MNQNELQKLLTSFEKEVGNIKQWEIDRNDRLRAQSKTAAMFGTKADRQAKSRKGGLTNSKSGHCARIANLGGKANVKSGHIKSIQTLATNAASEKNKKEVIKLDKNGNMVNTYLSVHEAAILNNKTSSTISNNIAGRTQYCGGFKYQFKNNEKDLDMSN